MCTQRHAIGWSPDTQAMVQSEVDKLQQRRVELQEGQHDLVVNIHGQHLQQQERSAHGAAE